MKILRKTAILTLAMAMILACTLLPAANAVIISQTLFDNCTDLTKLHSYVNIKTSPQGSWPPVQNISPEAPQGQPTITSLFVRDTQKPSELNPAYIVYNTPGDMTGFGFYAKFYQGQVINYAPPGDSFPGAYVAKMYISEDGESYTQLTRSYDNGVVAYGAGGADAGGGMTGVYYYFNKNASMPAGIRYLKIELPYWNDAENDYNMYLSGIHVNYNIEAPVLAATLPSFVNKDQPVTLTFNNPIDSGTLTAAKLTVNSAPVTNLAIAQDCLSATFNLPAGVSYDTDYNLLIANTIEDIYGSIISTTSIPFHTTLRLSGNVKTFNVDASNMNDVYQYQAGMKTASSSANGGWINVPDNVPYMFSEIAKPAGDSSQQGWLTFKVDGYIKGFSVDTISWLGSIYGGFDQTYDFKLYVSTDNVNYKQLMLGSGFIKDWVNGPTDVVANSSFSFLRLFTGTDPIIDGAKYFKILFPINNKENNADAFHVSNIKFDYYEAVMPLTASIANPTAHAPTNKIAINFNNPINTSGLAASGFYCVAPNYSDYSVNVSSLSYADDNKTIILNLAGGLDAGKEYMVGVPGNLTDTYGQEISITTYNITTTASTFVQNAAFSQNKLTDGTLTADITFTNYTSSPKTVTGILAVYDNGRFVGIKYVEITAQAFSPATETTPALTLSGLSATGCQAKTMIFESLSGSIKPMTSEVKVLNQ